VLAPRPPDPYLVAWRDLRRRQTALLVSLAAWGLGVCIAKDLGRFMALPFIVTLARVVFFPCPNCRRFINFKLSGFGGWRGCFHCGLEIGTPKDALSSDVP
jgi:hypothetical protein